MNPIKPIVIDYNYRIINNASGQISRVFWHEAKKHNFEPKIFCSQQSKLLGNEENACDIPEKKIIRKILRGIEYAGLKDITLIPDIEFYSWCGRAYDIIKNSTFSEESDYIHTISTPMSLHILGLQLKRDLNKPLIAQFNDPWHDASGRKYRLNYFRELDLKYERQVSEGADLIIHSNQVIYDIWVERYGNAIKDKMIIIPFNFNIYPLPSLKQSDKEGNKFVISHIGSIYSTRSSIDFIKAVSIFVNRNPKLRKYLKVNYIGGVHKSEIDYVRDLQLQDIFNYIGTLPPEQLDKYYQESDAFLIVDVKIKRSPNYPSKMMMYYYYRKPILGITLEGSQLEYELNENGHTCSYYGDVDVIIDFLKKGITDYNSLLNFKTDRWEEHKPENVWSIYNSAISALLNKGHS